MKIRRQYSETMLKFDSVRYKTLYLDKRLTGPYTTSGEGPRLTYGRFMLELYLETH